MAHTFRKKITMTVTAGLFFLAIGICAVQANAADESSLQAQIDSNNQQVDELNKEIATYEAKIKQAGADKKTLQAALDSLDLQRKAVQAHIEATQHTINTTQLQIDELDAGIASTSKQLAITQDTLGDAFRKLQQLDEQPFLVQVLGSQDISEVWQSVEVLGQFNSGLQSSIQTLQTQQDALSKAEAANKAKHSTLVDQQDTLNSQQSSLVETTKSKSQLLAETNSDEAKYQKLLAAAQAQLASFSAFAANAGGSGLLTNQTSCDSWGCYYNQRDSAWGNTPLNGTKYAMKSDGCLVTAMAMVLTHYGFTDVTPATIDANPENFAAYYPAYLLTTVQADGKTATRVSTSIDSTLATGNPVIVGLNAYGGTHFVVLVSGSKGNYLMRDPYVPNAKDIPFSSHYTMGQIYEIQKVVIS